MAHPFIAILNRTIAYTKTTMEVILQARLAYKAVVNAVLNELSNAPIHRYEILYYQQKFKRCCNEPSVKKRLCR
ncbi:hypothetical protein SAMN05444277_108142 [Parafilimonas terrae]|uniref:Uncharacterized protein n=1 Tax=Parafilimonas terrae TaxID=1465490 RepID=A0A1I5XG35_9BACT|nr:hypothetical protein SAMN05444277_108142 [Parafilimonas terrae]